jgi:hypothetical protein
MYIEINSLYESAEILQTVNFEKWIIFQYMYMTSILVLTETEKF